MVNDIIEVLDKLNMIISLLKEQRESNQEIIKLLKAIYNNAYQARFEHYE
jgi:molecular chaperone GrpE (heat shock protein)